LKKQSPPVLIRGTRALTFVSAACSFALMIIVGVGTAGVVLAAAQSPAPTPNQLFGVHPVQEGRTTLPGGHFNFALVPGQKVADAMVVENLSNHPLMFTVYGADLVTAVGGGLSPAQPTVTMRAVGAWIVVSVPRVTIAAHAQATDTFTITVPSTASVGQHLGAVVASADVGVSAQGTPIEARAALITVVTVPGSVRPAAVLSSLSGSPAGSARFGFAITLSNAGNVLLTYAGSVTIDDADGRTIARLALGPSNAYVVPSGHVPLATDWNEPASLADTYRAQATVTVFADGKPIRILTSQSLTLQLSSGVPALPLIALALAIVALLLLLAWIVRGVSGRRRAAPARFAGQSGLVT
jgi:hypothetical protein